MSVKFDFYSFLRKSRSSIILAQESDENGGYNVENLILLCSNCYNLIQNQDKSFSEIPLRIRDDLYDLL